MTKKAQKLVFDEDDLPKSKDRCVKKVSSNSDQGYFNTYSHFAIHHEMLTVIGVDFNFLNYAPKFLYYY